jgi:polyphosphate kinase
MDRNFFRRVEIAFPILDPRLKKRVISEGLRPYLEDNSQVWEMNAEGAYQPKSPRGKPVAAQELLLERLAGNHVA